MFNGEYDYRIDEKGRVPIPPRFRHELTNGLVLASGVERCISIYPQSEWTKLANSLTSGPIVQSKLRKLNRVIFGTSFNTELDGQGRIIIPAPLKQYAGIKEEVVVVGVNTILELWDKAQWESEKSVSLEEAWQTIESMEKR